jgi:hypothetical protein
MDKFRLTGQNRGQVFNFRCGCVHALNVCCFEVKQPNLKLKTWPTQFFEDLPVDIMLPAAILALYKIEKPEQTGFIKSN